MQPFIAASFLFFLLPQRLLATDWQLNGIVNQVFGYEDNVRMSQQPQGSFEYLLTPTLNFARKETDWNVGGAASYGLQQYAAMENLNNSPQNYAAQGEYRAERIRWGLGGNYSEALSRNFADTDTGNFASSSSRVNWSLSPSVSYSLTTIDSLILSSNYTQSTYSNNSMVVDNAANQIFSNNTSQSVSLAYQRQWSERLQQSSSGFYNRNVFSGSNTGEANTYGLNVTLSYRFSPLWRFAGTVGGRMTKTDNAQNVFRSSNAFNSNSNGFLADFNLAYQGEQTTLTWVAGRSLVPTGQGSLSEQTYFSSNWGYKFNQRLTAGLDLSYRISTNVNGQNQSSAASIYADRTNFSIEPRISWLLDRDWTTSLSYRYRQQDSRFFSDSTALMLTLNYNWPGFNLSR